jgi:hypothetical protein
MVLPATTEQWIRPSRTFTCAPDIAFDDVHYRMTFARFMDTHVCLINRYSFALPNSARRGSLSRSIVFDYTGQYFVDSAVAAIGDGESREDIRPARLFLTEEWPSCGLWNVWWWADSEDKARAIIADWREKPPTPRDHDIVQSCVTVFDHRPNVSAS